MLKKVYDPERLLLLKESLGGDLVEIIDTYLEDTPLQLQALLDSVRQEKTQETHRIAHLLTSSSGIFGAKRMVNACYLLELAAKNGDQITEPSLTRIQIEFNQLRDQLLQFKAETK